MSDGKDKTLMRPRVRRGNADDAQQLRQDLLDAALDLFADGGLEAVSVRGVAGRVGVSPMAMYRYFADKRELLGALSDFALDEAFARVRDAVASTEGAAARLRAALQAYIEHWAAEPEQYCLAFGFSSLRELAEPAPRPPQQMASYEEGLALWRQLIEELARAIGAPLTGVKLAQDCAAAMLLGYMHGVFALRRYPWGEIEPFRAAYIEQIEQVVERCLLGQH